LDHGNSLALRTVVIKVGMRNKIIKYNSNLRMSSSLFSRCRLLCSLRYLHISINYHMLRFVFITTLLFMYSDLVAATDTSILIIKSGNDSVYNQVANTAVRRMEQLCAKRTHTCLSPSAAVKAVGQDVNNSVINSGRWDLIVTIGTKAANLVSRSGTRIPTLYSLIPSSSFNNIRKTSHSSHISAIFIDQPITRELALVKAVMPERKNVGVILGRYSTISKSSLSRRMHSMHLNPNISYATPDNLNRIVEGKLQKIEVLLALPDPSIYNKQSVLAILLSSYRHRVPIIGYSAAFVKSGAIAAVYSTPGDIGRQIGDEIVKFASPTGGNLSSPSHPRYFSININQSVASSLNILIPSISTIRSRILKAPK
jgi:putative tryptophan/tyrosine transport system substrate-binding protein